MSDTEPAALLDAFCTLQGVVGAVLRADGDTLRVVAAGGPVEPTLGFPAAALEASLDWALVHPDDRASVRTAWGGALREPGVPQTVTVRLRGSAGYRPFEVRAVDLRGIGGADGLLVTARPGLSPARREGLPDRPRFLARVAQEQARRALGVTPGFAVVLLRLDRHAAVVEALGREAGDRLLDGVSARVRGLLGDGLLARIAADELAMLIEGVHEAGRVRAWCELLRAAVAEPVEVLGQRTFTSASIGVAGSADATGQPEELLEAAEAALRRAVRQGGGRLELYDASLRDAFRQRLELEADLRQARQRGELELRFQPVVDLHSGQLAGFEALLRWQRLGGIVDPSDFVPLAEESDSIHGIGRWVLDRACDEAARWHERGHALAVSVNVSTRQLGDRELVPAVSEALRRTGLPPSALRLEVTESALVDHPEAALAVLRALAGLGVGVVLDDFGTGWASLGYLHRFPFDALKIDRAFLEGLGRDEAPGLVPAILAMARSSGMSVVAEGIEQRAQLDALRRLGCPFGQGYFFAPPATADALPALCLRERWLGD